MHLLVLGYFGLLLSLCESRPQDFVNNKNGYQFIYHGEENLLLVVHKNECYFSSMPDNNNQWTESASQRSQAETTIIDFIEGRVPKPSSGDDDDPKTPSVDDDDDSSSVTSPVVVVKETNLAAMRDRYQDRLADFHCLDRNIFDMTVATSFWTASQPTDDD